MSGAADQEAVFIDSAGTAPLHPAPPLWRREHAGPAGAIHRCAEPRARTPGGNEYRLSARDGLLTLEFTGRGGSLTGSLGEPGAFTAELWRGEVAELFLANPQTGAYLEINLSPSGAWWACLFSSPRVPCDSAGWQIPGWSSAGGADGTAWFARATLPEQAVLRALQVRKFAELRGNVCFINRSAREDLFCSLASLPGAAPDFHQPQAWLSVQRRGE